MTRTHGWQAGNGDDGAQFVTHRMGVAWKEITTLFWEWQLGFVVRVHSVELYSLLVCFRRIHNNLRRLQWLQNVHQTLQGSVAKTDLCWHTSAHFMAEFNLTKWIAKAIMFKMLFPRGNKLAKFNIFLQIITFCSYTDLAIWYSENQYQSTPSGQDCVNIKKSFWLLSWKITK